jgi:two-component system KDP operon response regulator KdpE
LPEVDVGQITVLVIVGDPEIRQSLSSGLVESGYAVELEADGSHALAAVQQLNPHVILLGLDLMGESGLEVCRHVREEWHGPIVVIAAPTEASIAVKAFEAGADDFMTQPFGMAELLARIRALLRRTDHHPGAASATLEFRDVSIDVHTRTVLAHGRRVHLRPKEFDVLHYLASNPGQLVGHRELLRAVWGTQQEAALYYLHVCISQLRRKIELDPAHPRIVLTQRGRGYRFGNPELAALAGSGRDLGVERDQASTGAL